MDYYQMAECDLLTLKKNAETRLSRGIKSFDALDHTLRELNHVNAELARKRKYRKHRGANQKGGL